MSARVKIVAILTALPGKARELQAMLLEMQAASRSEPGNVQWDIWRDQANPHLYVLDELYVSVEAAAVHRETPHFRDYLDRVAALAQRNPMTLNPVSVG